FAGMVAIPLAPASALRRDQLPAPCARSRVAVAISQRVKWQGQSAPPLLSRSMILVCNQSFISESTQNKQALQPRPRPRLKGRGKAPALTRRARWKRAYGIPFWGARSSNDNNRICVFLRG